VVLGSVSIHTSFGTGDVTGTDERHNGWQPCKGHPRYLGKGAFDG
jgi:hypothetical protein